MKATTYCYILTGLTPVAVTSWPLHDWSKSVAAVTNYYWSKNAFYLKIPDQWLVKTSVWTISMDLEKGHYVHACQKRVSHQQ